MKAIITVGLGFGDEGKGAAVDFLTRQLAADLVVRYSGGAQAGHNVQLPDGRRHTFAQFGAGTLAGARTYLGRRMIISPTALLPEAEHLRALGVEDPLALLEVHPQCLVATVYHALMNRLRETARGRRRHGSCGLGIGESRHYWLKFGHEAVIAEDLHDRPTLLAKLILLRERLLLELQDLPVVHPGAASRLYELRPTQLADELLQAAESLRLSGRMPACRVAIFEGAQGVLLDEWRGFHPHTTWSTVTPWPAWEMLDEHESREVSVWGVTRAYSTRHGAGPFPTWCREMSARLLDPGNPPNAWQGAMRSGPLDLVLLEYAARVSRIDGLIVNGLDQLPDEPRVCTRYAHTRRLEIPQSLEAQSQLTLALETAVPQYAATTPAELVDRLGHIAPVVLTGRGPTHRDRHFGNRVPCFEPATGRAARD